MKQPPIIQVMGPMQLDPTFVANALGAKFKETSPYIVVMISNPHRFLGDGAWKDCVWDADVFMRFGDAGQAIWKLPDDMVTARVVAVPRWEYLKEMHVVTEFADRGDESQ